VVYTFSREIDFAPGKLRLVPKAGSFRPITTFNRKVPKSLFTSNERMDFAL
jgi:hypothetical protein